MWYVFGVFIVAMVLVGLMFLFKKPKQRIVQGRMEPIRFEAMELPAFQGRGLRQECQHSCSCHDDGVGDALAMAASAILTNNPEPVQEILDVYREPIEPVQEVLDVYREPIVSEPVAEVSESHSFSYDSGPSYDSGSCDTGSFDCGGCDCGGGCD